MEWCGLERNRGKVQLGRVPASKATKRIWRWTRRISARQEDVWREQLALLGMEELVIHARPRGKLIRLELYDRNPAPLRELAGALGGTVRMVDAEKIAARANAPRRPLLIARDLGVIDCGGRWPATQPRPGILLTIGSAMAFGTGEHATTASCLRLLHSEVADLDAGWSCLDLGTGSGILAMAAEKLGAGSITAIDYDPRAVRAAQANMRRNRCRRVQLAEGDLRRWRPGRTRYRIVLANVFSEILRGAAVPIARSVGGGGCLLLSGILRPQEKEVLSTFLPLGFALEKAARRGKWVTLKLRAA